MEKCLVISFILIGSMSALQRHTQKQIDRLERRYEQDYVAIKENIRDLWDTVEQVNAVCLSEKSQTLVKKQPVRSFDGNTVDTIAHVTSTGIAQLSRGLAKEKEYVRRGLNDLTSTVAAVIDIYTNTPEKHMNHIDRIEVVCMKSEIEIEKLRHSHAKVIDELEMTKQGMEAEVNELRLVINQAIEEAIQKSVADRPSSCMDLAKHGVSSSGVYTLYYNMQPFTVYCLIDEGGGYTFISPETYMYVNINDLSNDNSHVIIRHRRKTGLQYESRIEQITRYKSRPVSVQYNAHSGYQGIVNSMMTPYIFVGLTPINLQGRKHLRDKQGYRSNGKDVTFVNCDGNPNGYFAFLFNHNKVSVSRKGPSPEIASMLVDTSTKVTGDHVPDKFLAFFELHFGGCGAYATTNNFGDISGAAVGIPYTCLNS